MPDRRVWGAMAWAAGFIGLLLVFVTPNFKATDNTGILATILGGAEAPFASPIFVKLMSILYLDVAGGVPWFGLSHYLALFWAMALFVHAFASVERARPAFWFVLVVFSLLCVTFTIRVGYNASSILLSGVSVLAFALYGRENKLTRATVAVCACGLVFGFLFRPRGMQGAMLLVAPALLALGAFSRSRYSLPIVLGFLLPIGVVGGVHFAWKSFFVSEEFQAFREWNRLRGQFHAYPIARANVNNVELLEANDWKSYHYVLLKDWIYPDEDVWNLEKLENIFKYTVPLPDEHIDYERIEGSVEELIEDFERYFWLLPVMAFGILLAPSRRVALWSTGYVLFLIVLALYLKVALRFPSRIADPMFTLGFASFASIVASDGFRRMAQPLARVGMAGVAALLTLGPVIEFVAFNYRDAVHRGKRAAQFEDWNRDFNKWFDGDIVFMQPAIMLGQDQNPLRVYDTTFDSVPLGWRTFSPQFYDFLRRYGLQRGAELLPFAIDNHRFFFVFGRNYVGPLYEFIRTQYGVRVCVRVFEGLSTRRYVVFQLVTDPNPPDEVFKYNKQPAFTPFDRTGRGAQQNGDAGK